MKEKYLSEAEELLKQLVAIPSVNPIGALPPLSKPAEGLVQLGEGRLTDFLEELLRSWDQDCCRQLVHRGRENLLVRLSAPQWQSATVEGQKPVVVLSAHQDTVPPGPGMERPWEPWREGDRLYGLGACDIKGGMTSILLAARRILEQPQPPRVEVVLAFTVNEEAGFTGARALAELFRQPDGRLLPRAPEAVVVAEPTELDLVVAHKGVVRWRIHTRGKAAHSSSPEAGENAIYRMAHVLLGIEEYHRQLWQRAADPWCGHPSISVGMISGGSSPNTVPQRCTIEVDRRLIPGETAEMARIEVRVFLEQKTGLLGVIEHEPPWMEGPPLLDQSGNPAFQRLAQIARQKAAAGQLVGAPYATDAAFFAQVGIPTVVFGPGSVAQAHSDEEWVSLDQVVFASQILYRWILDWQELPVQRDVVLPVA
jgi:acetylornithine deacetylase